MTGFIEHVRSLARRSEAAKSARDMRSLAHKRKMWVTVRIHTNEEFAASTVFKGRIAHGMLSASVISAAIANKLPGPGTIYMSQSLRFRAPVRAGDTVCATVTVKEIIPEKSRVLLGTDCTVSGQVVIEGEALVALPAPSRDRR